jgi:hypothetical protein
MCRDEGQEVSFYLPIKKFSTIVRYNPTFVTKLVVVSKFCMRNSKKVRVFTMFLFHLQGTLRRESKNLYGKRE